VLSIIKNAPGRAGLVLGVLAVSCAITACGSSSSVSTSTTASAPRPTAASASSSSNRTARRAALVACLKQHGVTLPGRPPGSGSGAGAAPGAARGFGFGGGFFGGGGFRNSKFAAAFRACGAQFGLRGGRPGRFRLSHAAIDKFVACVRRPGYKLPNPNFSGTGPVFPANIHTDTKFQAASRACVSVLRPPGAGAGPGGTTTTASS
jgi:hypothetical protein